MESGNTFTNVNFVLYMSEVGEISCKGIRGFSQEADYEQIQEGGLNECVHLRPKPVSKPFSIQVERYVGENYQDPFTIGTMLPELILKVSNRVGEFGTPSVQFLFRNCIVSGKSYNDLDAERSGLMIETTTITYESLEVNP